MMKKLINRQKFAPKEKIRRREFTDAIWHKNRLWFAVVLVALTLEIAADLLFAEVLRAATNAASGRSWELLRYAALMIIPWIVCGVTGELLEWFFKSGFVERALVSYRRHAFKKILDKSIGSFTKENSALYLSALTNDVAQINLKYFVPISMLFFDITSFVATLVVMLIYSWQLTIVTLVLSVIPLAASLALGGKFAKVDKAMSDQDASFIATIKDLLSGFSTVKSFRAEEEVAQQMNTASELLESVRKRQGRTRYMIFFTTNYTGLVVQVLVFIVAAVLAISGEVEAGLAIAFAQLIPHITTPVNAVPQMLANRRASLALVDKLAAACAENAARSGDTRIDSIGDGIRFENVSFGYDPDEPVLKDIDLTFEQGRSYAIVGASGSGKSTLLNLLLGYRDDYSGSIELGGAELRTLDLECLYDLVSIIQQNVFVFNSSIEQNITMFKDFPSDAVRSAADRAGLSALIAERGADYLCGENGAQLSGGEKQRISIARSLLRGAPVLLMDEATASLDAQTAHTVESAILDVDSLTRIIVTHRLEEAMLRRYDEIIVLNGGRIAEQGSFDELMQRRGYFHALYSVSHV